MVFEVRDIIQIVVLLVTSGMGWAKLTSESKHQSAQHAELKTATENQHAELKQSTTDQANEIGRRIDKLRGTIENVAGDSREHGARIEGLEQRVDRNEEHIDQLGRDLGVGRRA